MGLFHFRASDRWLKKVIFERFNSAYLMTQMAVWTLLLALFSLSSCEDGYRGVRQMHDANSPQFEFRVAASITRSDTLKLYYTTDGSIRFSETQTVIRPVEGKQEVQEAHFILPKGVVPSQIRLDFGNHQKERPVYLKWVSMAYRERRVVIPATLIFSYFRPNLKETEFNATSGMLRAKRVDDTYLVPSLYPKEGPLEEQIQFLNGR